MLSNAALLEPTSKIRLRGRLREEKWGGLHYIREIPTINVLNDVAFFILTQCDGEKTLTEIEDAVCSTFEAPRSQVKDDLHTFLLDNVMKKYLVNPDISAEHLDKLRLDLVRPASPEPEKVTSFRPSAIGMGEYTLSAPLKVLVELTHNCNLKCVHCFADADCNMITQNGWLEGELNTEQWCRVIDNLSDADVFDVFVSGGEPLIRKDIFEILEYLQKSDMGFCLLSNLTYIDDETAVRLKEVGCFKVEGNMDGYDAKTYDEFRGVEGAFEATVKGIKACLKADLPIRLNVTATKKNVYMLKDIVKTTAELGVKELCVVPLERGGRAEKFWEDLELSMEDQAELTRYSNEVARWAKEQYGDQFLFIGFSDFLHSGPENEILKIVNPNAILPACGAGKYHCSMAPNGRVILCPTAGQTVPIEPGDATKYSFREIWQTARIFEAIRHPDIKTCNGCEHFGTCGAGCPLTAYREFGQVGVFHESMCYKVLLANKEKALRKAKSH